MAETSPKNRNADPLDSDPAASFGMEQETSTHFKESVTDEVNKFKSLDYAYLIPYKKIFNAELLNKRAVRWILIFGLGPIVIFQIHRMLSLRFDEAVWLIQGYFCMFWATYFYSIIRPERTMWKRALGYAFFTAFVGIPLLLLVQTWPFIRALYAGTSSVSLEAQLFGFIFGVGVFEEMTKAAPLLIFILWKGKEISAREGLLLGLMSGIGFAAAEGVQYTIRASVQAVYYGAVTQQLVQHLFRIMAGPVLHGAWAGIVGWFIGIASRNKESQWQLVILGVAISAMLHGLYDVFASSLISLGLAAVTFLLFMNYMVHAERGAVHHVTPTPVADKTTH